MVYFYLHGFASGIGSHKATFFRDRFANLGIPLLIPDLNQGDFFHLSLSRQIQQVADQLPDQPVTLIGSSFGGLTAAWVAENHLPVRRLILLAPAFRFLDHWLPKLGNQLQDWKNTGAIAVYHYTQARSLPLSYAFVTDLANYPDAQLQRPVETLIVHGCQDEVIPISASQEYARLRPWVKLLECKSDHGLGTAMSQLWPQLQKFCQI
jgi:uncharacterized protein